MSLQHLRRALFRREGNASSLPLETRRVRNRNLYSPNVLECLLISVHILQPKCNEKTILERARKSLLASKLRFKKRRFARFSKEYDERYENTNEDLLREQIRAHTTQQERKGFGIALLCVVAQLPWLLLLVLAREMLF